MQVNTQPKRNLIKTQILSADWEKSFWIVIWKYAMSKSQKMGFSLDFGTWGEGTYLKFEGGRTHKDCRYWVKNFFLEGCGFSPWHDDGGSAPPCKRKEHTFLFWQKTFSDMDSSSQPIGQFWNLQLFCNWKDSTSGRWKYVIFFCQSYAL